MGKLWPLFLILSFICAVLNPHIGLFGLFLLVQLLVCFGMAVNIRRSIRIYVFALAEGYSDKPAAALQRTGCSLINALRVLSLVLFAISTFVSCGIWLLASGRASTMITNRDMTPFSLFSPESKAAAGTILLVFSVVFNLLATVALFIRCKQFTIQLKDMQTAGSNTSANHHNTLSFKINIPAVGLAWIAATTFGLFNTRFGWLSPPIHLFYLLYIVILTLTVSLYNKLANKSSPMGTNARYMLDNMGHGKPLNRSLQAIVWAVAAVILSVQVACSFIVQTGVFMVVDIGLDVLMLLLSCSLNIIVALLLCSAVRSMQPEANK